MTVLKTLVEAATRAPSGDNLQPWQFELDIENSRIIVHLDEKCDQSPLNAGQRMSRIALGAAVENIFQTASAADRKCELEIAADGSSISVRLSELSETEIGIPDRILDRVTNRTFYNTDPIRATVIERIAQATPALLEVQTHWITERSEIDQVADLVESSDRMLFHIEKMRAAFLENVRFDCSSGESVEWGLSLDSLEVQGPERIAFRLLPKMPQWMFRLARVSHSIGKKSANLVRSSSGICLLTSSTDQEPQDDIHVGRALQRAWLTLTEFELSAQPMMSLLILSNSLRHDKESPVPAVFSSQISELLGRLKAFVSDEADRTPVFLLRFGNADPPAARTRRIPVKEKCAAQKTQATQAE